MKYMSRSSGFTLIEVMVVLFIIGIMAAIVAPQILGESDNARLQKAALDIRQLENTLQMYKLKNSRYPTTEQGLDALVTAPTIEPIPRNYPSDGFIDRIPNDPWGNPYELMSPGEMGTIDIYSNGPDLQPGTDDDIGNWNMHEYLGNNAG
ncbi:type II secretion system major pseudopilin GspG [Salinimonas sp. HHU 13199]|uniref:Type II secretion system core protein G n=1 Tax=Salinimonas profundi TaxID=2729140 RepID=A0ABR8LMP6_9ALTE|nr:type II secretion system major pseudopilin GspG [Salinimonas profundi]MBD3585672.1 type II secretion system major pseudopilin GspG [Salinimonas profundi]